VFTYWLGSRIPIPPEKPASRKAGGGGRRDGSKPLGRIVGFPESDPLPERGPILRYRLEVVLPTLAPRIRHGGMAPSIGKTQAQAMIPVTD